jgi:hypothetical protein
VTYVCDSALGGVIPHQAWPGTTSTSRRDIDHGTTLALLDEFGHHDAGRPVDALDINIKHSLPLILGHLSGRLSPS